MKRQNLIKNIQYKQNNIEWEFYPDYNTDFPIEENELNSLSNDNLIDIINTLSDIEQQEEKRYEREFIKHGRAE